MGDAAKQKHAAAKADAKHAEKGKPAPAKAAGKHHTTEHRGKSAPVSKKRHSRK
jgi:hypothetical protein